MARYPALTPLRSFKVRFPAEVHTMAKALNAAHPHPTDKRRNLFGNSQDILAAIAHLKEGKFNDTAVFCTLNCTHPCDLLLCVYRRIMSVEDAIEKGQIPALDRAHIMVIATELMRRYHTVDWSKPRPSVTIRIKPVFNVRP